jgi:hypothetical protein
MLCSFCSVSWLLRPLLSDVVLHLPSRAPRVMFQHDKLSDAYCIKLSKDLLHTGRTLADSACDRFTGHA